MRSNAICRRSEIHLLHPTAHLLAEALIQYLKESIGPLSTSQRDYDCCCPCRYVEVVRLSESGHTHVHIHCPPLRQTVFCRTDQQQVIRRVVKWCLCHQLQCIGRLA